MSIRSTSTDQLSLELHQNRKVPSKCIRDIVKLTERKRLQVGMLMRSRKILWVHLMRRTNNLWMYVMVSLTFMSLEKHLPINVRTRVHIIGPNILIYSVQNIPMHKPYGVVRVFSQAHTVFSWHYKISPGSEWYFSWWREH